MSLRPRSDSITSETTDVSDNASTTTTLVEPLISDNNIKVSNAIPIPKNHNSQVRNHDEHKHKYSSSIRSWWSFSTLNTPQKDSNIIQNNNISMDEKLRMTSSNLNTDKSKSIRHHDKQPLLLKHDNGSSVSILTPINEDGPVIKQKIINHDSILQENKPRSSSPTNLNKLVTDLNTEESVNNPVSSNKSHISSSSSDSEISSSNDNLRKKRVTKNSSEIRRWSLFGTWSSSSTTLLDSSNDGENSDSSKEDSKGENNTSKNDKKQKPFRKSSNPLVNSLSDNNSSWVHFFQSKNAKKLITDGSTSHHVEHVEKKELEIPPSAPSTLSAPKNKKSLKITSTTEIEKKSSDTIIVTASPTLKPVPANVVLPKFEDFVRNKPRRRPNSMVQQALHAINSYFFPPERLLEGTLPKWLDELTRSTVDVKRIAIIGVHGWFPARLVRAVVGEPTGTSPKFCDMMAKAILGYLSQHGISLPSDAVTCIPLEGEGTISTREALLHKNLLNNKVWCEALSLADAVFVATHSQGTPVSTILLSRLIKEGLVHPKRQRICMLAMAGVSHGPFPYLKENYIMKYYVGAGRSHDADAARELFEFMDSETLVSKRYREALTTVINSGVKIVYVASMDDQVVPLYSGLFNGVNHPSIMRAIYIDGPLYQEKDFLTSLIVFAIKLRNAGILDHGIMVQLSEVVAGSMYGEGHSALYTEIEVYTLAVRYLFETPSLGACDLKLDRFVAQQKNNPFYLPWAMRGVLEDREVSESIHLKYETMKLRKQYEEWEPTTKAMKEVKFRLEPMRDVILGRSKL
ncbi:21325_t:CDS:2 [Rhizophagus irregularis]|nr:21325_t:CDS:2 [Rhizophagus irregularis]